MKGKAAELKSMKRWIDWREWCCGRGALAPITHSHSRRRQQQNNSFHLIPQLFISFFVDSKKWRIVGNGLSSLYERDELTAAIDGGRKKKTTQLLQQFHQMKGSTLPPSFDWSCWGAYRAAASSLAPRSIHSNSIRFLYFIENEMKGPLQLNWMNFTLFLYWLGCLAWFSSFGGAIGGATAHNPPKKDKPNPTGLACSIQLN